MSHTLLIADQDETLCHTLSSELAADGYQTLTAASPRAMALQLANHQPDLVVLGDFEGPGASARLLAALRGSRAPFRGLGAETPAILLAHDNGELALLRAFEAGADDYLVKPAGYLELRARPHPGGDRPLNRREDPDDPQNRALEIDTDAHRATYAGQPLPLSRLEFELLAQLGQRPVRVHSKEALLRDICGSGSPGASRTVDAHACRLRKKLVQAGAIDLVVNHRGVGYALTGVGGDTDEAA